jgi:type III secretory pathway component EscS
MHVSIILNLTQIQEMTFDSVILLIRVLKSFSLHCEIEITKPKKENIELYLLYLYLS